MTKMNTETSWSVRPESVRRVAEALGSQNMVEALEDCKISDVKHVLELLAHVMLLEEVAPGFLDGMFAQFLPHFIKEHNRAVVANEAQRRADAEGFGREWSEAIEAGRSKNQAGFKVAMVKVAMKARGISEEEARQQVAEHYGIDEESLTRAERRARKRGKP